MKELFVFCQLFIYLVLCRDSFGQDNIDTNKVKYYCSPCGCKYDDKIFDSSGKCPACNMKLLQVGTFNFEMASVSQNEIIVYASNKPDNKRVLYYRSLQPGSDPVLIGEGVMPQISADGKRILFERGKEGIFIYNAQTKTTKGLIAKIKLNGIQSPAWSATDNNVIFSAGNFPNIGIYKINIDDQTTKPLIAHPGVRYGCVPSPDGKKLAYRCVKGTTDNNRQRGIVVFDLSTKEEKYITTIGEYCKWSPDGKKLAFHWPDSSDFCIYTVNADGTGLKKIAGLKGNDYELPVWSADGKKIYFQTNRRRGNWEIWRMNSDGSDQQSVIWN